MTHDARFPIPVSVYSALGPVPVLMVDELISHDGDHLLGKWCPEDRCIRLLKGVHPVTMYATLLHEKLHCWQWDAGARPIDEDEEERVCDCISTMLLAETLMRS